MSRLQGKRALITGGTSGIGLETAKHFLAEGAKVVVTGSSPGSIAKAAQELGAGATVLRSDAGNVAEQTVLAAEVKKALGGLDILFVNAGIAEMRPLEAWDEPGFDRILDINFKGPLFLVQALLPLFANPASIVLNTSINALIGMPNTTVYGASKAALSSLIRTLSSELIGCGIRVNSVAPGPVETPLYGKLGLEAEKLQQVAAQIKGQVPAGRFGSPSEVAAAVVFLASDESPYIVGSELVIDGGMSNL